jgi:hypothetical protein
LCVCVCACLVLNRWFQRLCIFSCLFFPPLLLLHLSLNLFLRSLQRLKSSRQWFALIRSTAPSSCATGLMYVELCLFFLLFPSRNIFLFHSLNHFPSPCPLSLFKTFLANGPVLRYFVSIGGPDLSGNQTLAAGTLSVTYMGVSYGGDFTFNVTITTSAGTAFATTIFQTAYPQLSTLAICLRAPICCLSFLNLYSYSISCLLSFLVLITFLPPLLPRPLPSTLLESNCRQH